MPAKGSEPEADLPRDKPTVLQWAVKINREMNPLNDIIPKPVMAVSHIAGEVFRGKLELEDALMRVLEAGNELRILVTGKTGQGKSTLINGLLGAKVAKEGASAARCTTEVEEYTKIINGVPVVVFDSPGLQDNTSNEKKYIKNMKDNCQKLSLVLYCTKMINTRLGDDDKKAMKKLNQAFGSDFWNQTVFVLTFANMECVDRKDERDINEPLEEPPNDDAAAWELLMKRRFEGRVQLWEEELHQFLINEVKVDPSIANSIPVIPTGDHKITRNNPTPLRLPDRDNWFQELWETCSFRVREQGLFLKINSHRMTAVDEEDDGDDQRTCQIDDLPKKTEKKLPIICGEVQVSAPVMSPVVKKLEDSKSKASKGKESLSVKEHERMTFTTVTSHSLPLPKLQVKRRRPRSATIPVIMSTYERNELERFIPNSVHSQNNQHEIPVHPDIQSDEDDYIQVCEGPNENTPWEDAADEYNESDETTHATESKVVEGLQNESIRITANYATNMCADIIDKSFTHRIAEALKAALKLIAKPSQWFIKLIMRWKKGGEKND
uniref:AIG1-type G domain-containing protein n=1 Tax=Amphimedon queenslandica TaxID=400682 RepID=A0A1X7TXX4_AMPQE